MGFFPILGCILAACIIIVVTDLPARMVFRYEFGFWPNDRTAKAEQRILKRLSGLDDTYRRGALHFVGHAMTGGKLNDRDVPSIFDALEARERYRRNCILVHSFGYTNLCSIPKEL